MADIARSSYYAAVRRALPWEAVATGGADPSLLQIPENIAAYMRTAEGHRIVALWYPRFRRSLRDIRTIEEWVDGDLSNDEVLSLFDVVNVVDGWLDQIYQTLVENLELDRYEAT